MKCYTCGNIYQEHEGSLELQNNIIGKYKVYSVKYYKCAGCNELLFSKETAKKIEAVEEEKLNKLIENLPVKDFIMAAEAAEILGISKQAFSKHSRIKRGFIYSIIKGDKGLKLYSRKSVMLFKETRDGRFPLCKEKLQKPAKYKVINFVQRDTKIPSYGNHLPLKKPEHLWQNNKSNISKNRGH